MPFFAIITLIYLVAGITSVLQAKEKKAKERERHLDPSQSSRTLNQRNRNKQKHRVRGQEAIGQSKSRALIRHIVGDDWVSSDMPAHLEERFEKAMSNWIVPSDQELERVDRPELMDDQFSSLALTEEVPLETILSEEISDLTSTSDIEQVPEWLEEDIDSFDDEPMMTTYYRRKAKHPHSPYATYLKDKTVLKQLFVFREILDKPKGLK